MKIVVTGGAGYIGSVATEVLVTGGHEVVVFDNLQQGHREAVHSGARLVVGDLADPAAIDSALREFKPEAVLHFAANSLVGQSMQEPFLYLHDNVVNALNLLRSMDRHGVRKIILSSTANLFADPVAMPITESERIIPGSPYGESKRMVERLLHWLSVTRGLRYACLRYFNAAGATPDRGEHHTPELHLIPLVLQVVLGQRSDVTVFGCDYPTPDGTCVRDYIHVTDLVDAHVRALGALDQGNCTYNLGNGRGFSVLEVIAAARRITGHEIPIRMAARRAGDPAILVAGSDLIRRQLGWRPRFENIHSIVETAWTWHRNHPLGYTSQICPQA